MTICYRDSVMNTLSIENRGSLMTVANTNTCLGYLMEFGERGIFEPTYGKVEVTPEEAKKHNECLSSAEIKGLDDNCQVGQMGIFYFDRAKKQVHTFLGTLVSDKVQLTAGGKGITFLRNGRQYRGLLRKDDDSFTFKRIS